MTSYRLIDEQPGIKRPRPPWSPLGIFFLTGLFLPAGVPFWVLNWGRLGHPGQRWLALGVGIGIFVLSGVLFVSPLPREMVQLASNVARFAFGYFQLWGQSPLHDAHLRRGGAKAPAWPLWVAAAAGAALQFALYLR